MSTGSPAWNRCDAGSSARCTCPRASVYSTEIVKVLNPLPSYLRTGLHPVTRAVPAALRTIQAARDVERVISPRTSMPRPRMRSAVKINVTVMRDRAHPRRHYTGGRALVSNAEATPGAGLLQKLRESVIDGKPRGASRRRHHGRDHRGALAATRRARSHARAERRDRAHDGGAGAAARAAQAWRGARPARRFGRGPEIELVVYLYRLPGVIDCPAPLRRVASVLRSDGPHRYVRTAAVTPKEHSMHRQRTARLRAFGCMSLSRC